MLNNFNFHYALIVRENLITFYRLIKKYNDFISCSIFSKSLKKKKIISNLFLFSMINDEHNHHHKLYS